MVAPGYKERKQKVDSTETLLQPLLHVEMEAIFKLLQQHRLESYYAKFLQLGVKDERDFLDGVTDDDLTTLGLTQVEKTRFSTMRENIQRLRAPAQRAAAPVNKSVESFHLQYVFPKCPGPKDITDMDPAQNTVEDLMLRICYMETVDSDKGVCLYTMDGMPLTDDPFFNTWSLKDRHIKNGNVIYAIFTPKENLITAPQASRQEEPDTCGSDSVRCHIMLKGDFEVNVDLEKDTIAVLKKKLTRESGIPGHVLHYKGEHGNGNILESCGISEESTVYFSLSSFAEEVQDHKLFFTDDVLPCVQQTTKGISTFLSSLYILKRIGQGVGYKSLISYIRKLTGCHPLAQSLYQLFWRNEMVSRNQKIAVVEGMYFLFRELLPQLGTKRGDKIIEDQDVFEYSTYCWAYLLSEAKDETPEHENYAPFSLVSDDNMRFWDPVNIPGVPGVLERAAVIQKIQDGEKIPNCTEENLQEMSLRRATDIEKILLSVHPSIRTYHLWIRSDSVITQNFHVEILKSFGDMAEDLNSFPRLKVTPPLYLKSLGCDELRLVYLSKDNLGIYLSKDKMSPAKINVYDCLTGKEEQNNVDELAARTGDQRDDDSFTATRTPKEAIVVLIDTSSSMEHECYGGVDMKKIHAVIQLFDNFATRTMAYDFHHIIALVKFDSTVKTLHTFTETLEKFKDHVHTLKATGKTKLYDALHQAMLELDKVKKIPNCRRRILCLTDGKDVSSVNKPDVVTAKLIKSDIIVDSIILENVSEHPLQKLRKLLSGNILQGISHATGGCCFRPKTSKDGLKLFEIETVLSLELRKPKTKANPSAVTEEYLKKLSAGQVYDTFPEAILPSKMKNKVTVTESALKNNQASKVGQLMEKDKRILEELRNLHCSPHPYFTIYPSESDITFWKILMEGPPDTPYEEGVFELFCEFGSDYPVKPPLIRFVTPVYHCNINSVGRICHNIFDRNYNAHITMRDIFNAVFGLLIVPEPEDPLDSVLAEEFLSSPATYQQMAQKHTEKSASKSQDDLQKGLVDVATTFIPSHLLCPLTNKLFIDPVETKSGRVYERKAIEKHLKTHKHDPKGGPGEPLCKADLKPAKDMKKMVKDYRMNQCKAKR